jgi:small conductance mechanosensitive channel
MNSLDPTLRHIIIAAGILLIAVIISTLIRRLIGMYIKKNTKYLKIDPTKYNFLKNAMSFIVYTIAAIIIFYTIPSLRSLGTTLFAGAGIFAAILAFASQQAFSNIIGGVFIVIFKPFRVDDFIDLGPDRRGLVEDITLRHTVIRDFQNKRVIVPNSVISSETIVNNSITDERIKRFVEVGISYDSDIDKAIAIIQEEARKHPNFSDQRTEQEKKDGEEDIVVRVLGFGESSINLRAYVWADDWDKAFVMHCDLNKSIKKRFDNEGIEIPFPYRTIVYKNHEQKDK